MVRAVCLGHRCTWRERENKQLMISGSSNAEYFKISPLLFILALKHIRLHDKGVQRGAKRVHTLGYTDDVTLTDDGSGDGIVIASARATSIASGSKKDADSHESQNHKDQGDACPPSRPGERHHNKWRGHQGLQIRMSTLELWISLLHHTRNACTCGTLRMGKEFEVECILAWRGPTWARQVKIRWKDYNQEDEMWEPRGNVHPEAMKQFEIENNLYVQDWPFRRRIYDLPSTPSVVSKSTPQECMNATTKRQARTSSVSTVGSRIKRWGSKKSKNSKLYVPLSSVKTILSRTSSSSPTLERYSPPMDSNSTTFGCGWGKTMSRCGRLGHLFDSPNLGPWLKIRLYVVVVVSLLTYGCESYERHLPCAN